MCICGGGYVIEGDIFEFWIFRVNGKVLVRSCYCRVVFWGFFGIVLKFVSLLGGDGVNYRF